MHLIVDATCCTDHIYIHRLNFQQEKKNHFTCNNTRCIWSYCSSYILDLSHLFGVFSLFMGEFSLLHRENNQSPRWLVFYFENWFRSFDLNKLYREKKTVAKNQISKQNLVIRLQLQPQPQLRMLLLSKFYMLLIHIARSKIDGYIREIMPVQFSPAF